MIPELSEFHFLRPWWLLSILPLLLIAFSLNYLHKQQSGWQSVIASHLYKQLISVTGKGQNKPPVYLLFIGWLLTALALAGPTWERLPQPVYQLHTGKVVIMDMSLSMRSTDLKPNRLSRAKYKAIDLVKQAGEGEIGLIAYAGDAFVISPLSSDSQNLTALIPSLTPEIMPTPGSEPEYAFEEAITLLTNAGYQQGDIFWITDGVALSQVAPITQMLSQHDYRLSILGVGTSDGAPIKLANNELLKDERGAIVVPRFDDASLQTLARKGRGRYVDLQPNDSDINYLVQQSLLDTEISNNESEPGKFGDQWKEVGPYLLLLLLPFAAFVFRRGVLILVFVATVPFTPPPAAADTWWNNLWQRPDQQGQQAFAQEDFAQAEQRFSNPEWKGSAAYRAGNYEQAISHFAQSESVNSQYNLGNAYAKNGGLEEALQAYDKVLTQQPDHADALANKALIEELLKQQEQQQQNQQQNQDSQEQSQDQSQSDQNSQSDDQSQQQDQQQSGQDSDSESDSEQSSDSQAQSEESESSSQEQESQSESDSQQEQQQEESQSAQGQQDESQDATEQSEAQAAQANEELTEEQKEQQQKMQTLLRKVPDDPAYLLKRKMQLEQERRKRQRVPSQSQRNW